MVNKTAKIKAHSRVLTQRVSTRMVHAKLSSKLDLYIIDCGWDSVGHCVLQKNMDVIKAFAVPNEDVYVLTGPQSIEFLKIHPELIRREPLILMLDRQLGTHSGHASYGGVCLCLGGQVNINKVNLMLKTFMRVLVNRRNMHDICSEMRKFLHKERVQGAVEIIMEEFGRES